MKKEPTVQQALEFAAEKIKQGEISEGKRALEWVLRKDPDNVLALLWMSRCLSNNDTKVKIFQRILRIDPTNEHAKKGLKVYTTGSQKRVAKREEPPEHPREKSGESQESTIGLTTITLEAWTLIPFLGGLLLTLGVFLPIVQILVIGSMSLIEIKFVGAILLVYGISVFPIGLVRRYEFIWVPGLGSFGLIASSFGALLYIINEIKSIATDYAENDWLGGLFAEITAESINIQWGWGFVFVGCLLLLFAGMYRFNWQKAKFPIIIGSILAIAIPGLIYGVPGLRPDEVSMLAGANDIGIEEDGVDDLTVGLVQDPTPTRIRPTPTRALSCSESIGQYALETEPLVTKFGELSMQASQSTRMSLSPILSDLTETYNQLLLFPKPNCATQAASLMVQGHKTILDGFIEYFAEGNVDRLLEQSEKGFLDIENSLLQLTAKMEGKSTPTPKPLPSRTPRPTLTPTATPLAPGSSIQVENWEIRVDSVLVSDQVMWSAGGDIEKAKGRFALLFIDVTNRGFSQDTFVAFGLLGFKDTQGNSYEYNIMASTYAMFEYNTDIGARINPDESFKDIAVFDISVDPTLRYILGAGSLTGTSNGFVYVDIP